MKNFLFIPLENLPKMCHFLYLETLTWESFQERKYEQERIEVETPKDSHFQKDAGEFLSAVSEMKHCVMGGEDLELSMGIPESEVLSWRMCWCRGINGIANFLEVKKLSVRQSF